MILRILFISPIILLTCISINLEAQDLPDSVTVLKGVEIISKRELSEKGLIKTEVGSMVIKETINSSLAELLSNHTPVFIKSYGQGSLATVSFRGTSASHTQVDWNGININNPMIGQVDFSLIPIYFIDKIELYHGGSSLQEGSGALGGNVQLSSKPQWNKKIYGNAIQGIGSFNTYQSFITVGGGSKNLQTKVRLFHEQSENDFIYYNKEKGDPRYEKQTNANYFKYGGLGEIHYRIGHNNIISLSSWIQYTNRNLPAIMSFEGDGRKEYQHDNVFRLTGNWSKYWEESKSELIIGYNSSSLNYYLGHKNDYYDVVNYNTHNDTKSIYNKHKYSLKISNRTEIKSLISYNFHKVYSFNKELLNGYDAERNEAGASLSIHHMIHKKLAVNGLIRKDLVDDKFSPLMPSVALELSPLKRDQILIKTSFTRNYHQPTLNDLYWMPGGNADLIPEQGYTGDLAISYSLKNNKIITLNTSLTGYLSRINNWIIWKPGEYRYWTADNIKDVYARGFEYFLSLNYTKSNYKISFVGNYAYTKTTNQTKTTTSDESYGKQLIYIPIHKANITANAGYKNYYLSYIFTYNGERFTTSSNEDTRHNLQFNVINNLSVGRKFLFKDYSCNIQFKINNLFNEDYQEILSRAMPGRNYMLLINFSF